MRGLTKKAAGVESGGEGKQASIWNYTSDTLWFCWSRVCRPKALPDDTRERGTGGAGS
jgi:hypothetical protein